MEEAAKHSNGQLKNGNGQSTEMLESLPPKVFIKCTDMALKNMVIGGTW